MEVKINNRVLELIDGDLTEMDTDVIVNAANAQLILGGGVAGAIRRKGGPEIQAECDKAGGTFVGGAVITTGDNLNARHVIHAVGPRMGEGDEDKKLKNATLNSLKTADENHLKSISFPAISTGIFGYPVREASRIALKTISSFLKNHPEIKLVKMVLFSQEDYQVYKDTLDDMRI